MHTNEMTAAQRSGSGSATRNRFESLVSKLRGPVNQCADTGPLALLHMTSLLLDDREGRFSQSAFQVAPKVSLRSARGIWQRVRKNTSTAQIKRQFRHVAVGRVHHHHDAIPSEFCDRIS